MKYYDPLTQERTVDFDIKEHGWVVGLNEIEGNEPVSPEELVVAYQIPVKTENPDGSVSYSKKLEIANRCVEVNGPAWCSPDSVDPFQLDIGIKSIYSIQVMTCR